MEISKLCTLHGWQPLDLSEADDSRPRVYDAIIFSIELDLLEIRLKELYDVVEKFLILESATTFTGKPKALVFHENRERFRFAEDKIQYKRFVGKLNGVYPFNQTNRPEPSIQQEDSSNLAKIHSISKGKPVQR